MKKLIILSIFVLLSSCTEKNNSINVNIPDTGIDAGIDANGDVIEDSGYIDWDAYWNNGNNSYNNDAEPAPEIISVSPTGVVRDATEIVMVFSRSVRESCADAFYVTVGTTPVSGTYTWENNNTILKWQPIEPFVPGIEYSYTIYSTGCVALTDNQHLQWASNWHFQIDTIECEVWGSVKTYNHDVSVVDTPENGYILSPDGNVLFTGVMYSESEVRNIFTFQYTFYMNALNLEKIVGVYFILTETDSMGTPPETLVLEPLNYSDPIDTDDFFEVSTGNEIITTTEVYLPADTIYERVYFNVTDYVIPSLQNSEVGVTFRMRGSDLLYDGEDNARAFWSSESVHYGEYGPALRFCYWNYDHFNK